MSARESTRAEVPRADCTRCDKSTGDLTAGLSGDGWRDALDGWYLGRPGRLCPTCYVAMSRAEHEADEHRLDWYPSMMCQPERFSCSCGTILETWSDAEVHVERALRIAALRAQTDVMRDESREFKDAALRVFADAILETASAKPHRLTSEELDALPDGSLVMAEYDESVGVEVYRKVGRGWDCLDDGRHYNSFTVANLDTTTILHSPEA